LPDADAGVHEPRRLADAREKQRQICRATAIWATRPHSVWISAISVLTIIKS